MNFTFHPSHEWYITLVAMLLFIASVVDFVVQKAKTPQQHMAKALLVSNFGLTFLFLVSFYDDCISITGMYTLCYVYIAVVASAIISCYRTWRKSEEKRRHKEEMAARQAREKLEKAAHKEFEEAVQDYKDNVSREFPTWSV